MHSKSIAIALTCLVAAGVELQDTAATWKTWVDANVADFSGVVLVGRGDEILTVQAYGLADGAADRANTIDTRFNLGSINKTFTALAIAQLIQRGRLSLDDVLAKHLPEYPNREAAAKITIRNLITHRSGIATFMRLDFGDATSLADLVKHVGAAPQSFEPGARQEYSNGGYVVLGRVVEVVSGQSYDDYVANHIYKPAGMTRTSFVEPGASRRGNPAGGGYSTAADLFNFARALRTGKLLDARMTDYVLHGTFAGDRAAKFGFALREQIAGARRFIGNGGGAPGLNAEFRFEPAGDYIVVVLANSSPPAATRLLNAILERLAGSGTP